MSSLTPCDGHALFSHGFRPFFLAAIVFAASVISLWLLVWREAATLGGPFGPVDWHVHEMLFGYAGAVITGFLFTAIPNWTGRKPRRGRVLVALAALWLAGRLAVAGLPPLTAPLVMGIDCAFLLAIAVLAAVEIVAGRNWRNLMVVVLVLLLVAANAMFHVEAIRAGASDASRRLSLSVVVFLIVLIGGRIIPGFTRNWLAQRQAAKLPVVFGRFDAICLAVTAFALLLWIFRPVSTPTALLLAGASLLLLARLARWQGLAVRRSPLLLMLHVAYAFGPAGLTPIAAAADGLTGPAAGLHLLGIGAVGGMTVAVMMRATLGHTGRSLVAGPWLAAAFALIVAAALVRAVAPQVAGLDGIAVAALLWTLGYGILAVSLAPWLILPNPARRKPGCSVSLVEKVNQDRKIRLLADSALLMSRSSEASLTMTGAGR